MNFIDLSHTINGETLTYKGLPAPIICDFLSREASKAFYEEGATFQIGKIEMVTNTGTYLDVPFHRYADGFDLSALLLSHCANLPTVVVNVANRSALAIDLSDLAGLDVAGKAILIYTNWAQHWGTPQYFEQHPFLTEAAAAYLKENGACLVGIDSHNIDDTRTRRRPVHSLLLGAGIVIVEHLCQLGEIPLDKAPEALRFYAVPPKFEGVGTFPVRAFVSWED